MSGSIFTFQEVTPHLELDDCRRLLETVDWDLSQACQLALDFISSSSEDAVAFHRGDISNGRLQRSVAVENLDLDEHEPLSETANSSAANPWLALTAKAGEVDSMADLLAGSSAAGAMSSRARELKKAKKKVNKEKQRFSWRDDEGRQLDFTINYKGQICALSINEWDNVGKKLALTNSCSCFRTKSRCQESKCSSPKIAYIGKAALLRTGAKSKFIGLITKFPM